MLIGNENFPLEARIYGHIRRTAGLVMDMDRFRSDPMYAQSILEFVHQGDDPVMRDIAGVLIQLRGLELHTEAAIRDIDELRRRLADQQAEGHTPG